MSDLQKILREFDKADVDALDAALGRFHQYKGSSGLPDYSPSYVAYTPVLAFALLKSQATLERLTRRLWLLTLVLATLAIAQVVTVIVVSL